MRTRSRERGDRPMKALVPSAGLLLLLIAVVAGGIGTAQTPDAVVQITSLSVERGADGVEVRIKTSGTARFQSSFIDTPNRLVVDLPGATYAWSKSTVNSDADPVRQVRGSQWKGSVARVVVELTREGGSCPGEGSGHGRGHSGFSAGGRAQGRRCSDSHRPGRAAAGAPGAGGS